MLTPGVRTSALLVLVTFAIHLGASPLDPVQHTEGFVLNSFIRHYEPARYDPTILGSQHNRVRRSLTQKHDVYLEIRGHGRTFRLRLTPDREVFTEDVMFESTEGPVKFDSKVVYSGTLEETLSFLCPIDAAPTLRISDIILIQLLNAHDTNAADTEDDEGASVHGIITKEGLFDGMVSTTSEDYYIEPVSRYLSSNQSQKSPSFHSIVYKTSDVDNPRLGFPCASHTFKLNKLEQADKLDSVNFVNTRRKRWVLEGDAKEPYDEFSWHPNKAKRPFSTSFDISASFNQPIDEEMTTSNRTSFDFNLRHVNKRATIDPKKTTCMLYLQADHQFFQKYGTEEACIEVMTRHVQRVNAIYKLTDFNQDGKLDNITFMIKRIKVHTTEALKDPLYRYPNNYGVEKFLELFSEEDYDAFCLAYMFTYRDFEMGTLGLAWTGDLKNAGGVCEKNGHYRGSMKSLNTGIVTLLNYGKHVPPAVSHVTLAHEIGHNFGSPHDPEICTPGGEDGNFIMFARATSGDKKNNNRFSPCSLKSINPVLNFKARSSKGCFTEPQASLCGNGVVEEGEECDCGWEEDCRDECCFPQRRYPPLDEPPCHLTPRSICSPSQGPCCNSQCQVKFGDKCRDDNGCRDSSFCNGRGPQCPPSVNKPNKTICNQEFVCFMGECTGSICLAYGLESCQCIPFTNDPKTKACELCCKLPGENQPCLSSFEWNEMPYDVPDMYSKPGTPCNDYNGYCDVFQKCREVDPSGPLATLRKLLLSEESIASFKKWVMDYWYVVTLIVISVIFILVFSTRLLGKRPNTKLKSVTIMHSSPTEAVRLPADAEGGVTVHPGIRSKLPLKRRVRDGRLRKKHKIKDNNNLKSPSKVNKKSPKKKKRVSAAVGAEESRKKDGNATVIEVPPSKVKKSPQHSSSVVKKKKLKKSKEVIDYSGEGDGKKTEVAPNQLSPEAESVGKVQNWLLKSQMALPKSKSTPACLTDKSQNRSPHKRVSNRPRPEKSKARSLGNLPGDKEKVRLQVVYKPPFKFSVKLRKPEKTNVVIEKHSEQRKVNKNNPRTGVLIRTVKEQDKPTTTTAAATTKKVAVAQNVTNAAKPITVGAPPQVNNLPNSGAKIPDDIDSNVHTVQSDLEVLLSESEFLFSDD